MKPVRLLPYFMRRRWIERTVSPFTLVKSARINSLFNLAVRIEREKIPGDVVECGVCNGGTAAVLAHFASRSKFARTVWLFDSFEGMPPPTLPDGEDAKEHIGKEQGTVQNVLKALESVDADLKSVRIVEGLFGDTFPTVDIPRIALLNVDADWYESVKLCFEKFYDSVVPGGYISIDDYGHWPGCRQAVDEFFMARGLKHQLNYVDYTARWFRKA